MAKNNNAINNFEVIDQSKLIDTSFYLIVSVDVELLLTQNIATTEHRESNMPSTNFIADDRYDALVDAILDIEPDPHTGAVDRCAIKIVLTEHLNLIPHRMAVTVIADDARDREIELKRGAQGLPANDDDEDEVA